MYLADVDFAKYFLTDNAIGPDETAASLVNRVKAWLARSGMGHRDPYAVADEVLQISRKQVPAPKAPVVGEAEAARLDDLHQGVGDIQQPLTAADIAALDMVAYAKLREQIGIGRNANARGLFL